jgi:hypothetical protein
MTACEHLQKNDVVMETKSRILSKFLFILGGWANPVVEPETLDDITLYD